MDPWYIVTLAGEPLFWGSTIWIVLLCHFLLRKRLATEKRKMLRKLAYVYVPGVLVSLLLVLALKELIVVPRPCSPCGLGFADCNPYCDAESSFPSGHAAGVFAVATALYLGINKKGFLALYVFSVLVASSRYFLGVHRIVDIVAGAIIGIAVPTIFLFVYKKEYDKDNENKKSKV
jgi:membrane-associated phospholipid phosphatase